jgi:hypothetical protein
MAAAKIPQQCPSCESQLRIKRMQCSGCSTSLEGDFLLPRLARLQLEDQRFLELFLLSSGSLKSVSKHLGVSYPTVRKRLNEMVSLLETEIERDEDSR